MYSYLKFKYFLFILIIIGQSSAEIPHRRFEYKFSFKPPYLAQRDGSVPFWKYGGSKYMRIYIFF